jgi:hypothetical protein
LGAEFKVHALQPDDQSSPAVAGDASGAFIVTWTDQFFRIAARAFGPDGSPAGDEFQVSLPNGVGQFRPDVAIAPDGSWSVIVWQVHSSQPPSVIRREPYPCGGRGR